MCSIKYTYVLYKKHKVPMETCEEEMILLMMLTATWMWIWKKIQRQNEKNWFIIWYLRKLKSYYGTKRWETREKSSNWIRVINGSFIKNIVDTSISWRDGSWSICHRFFTILLCRRGKYCDNGFLNLADNPSQNNQMWANRK